MRVGIPAQLSCHTKRSIDKSSDLHQLVQNVSESGVGRYVERLSLEFYHHIWYDTVHDLGLFRMLKRLHTLSLKPPPKNVDLAVCGAVNSLHLDYHDDRNAFWARRGYIPSYNLASYFRLANLRTLQIQHISFAPDLHNNDWSTEEPSPIETLEFLDCSP